MRDRQVGLSDRVLAEKKYIQIHGSRSLAVIIVPSQAALGFPAEVKKTLGKQLSV